MKTQAEEQLGNLSKERDLPIVEGKTRSKYHYAVEEQEKTHQGVSTGLAYRIHASCRTGRTTAGLLCLNLGTALQDPLKIVWNRTRKIRRSG